MVSPTNFKQFILFRCIQDNHGICIYTFFFYLLQATDKYIIYENGTFLINDITIDDASTYTCNVENAFGLMAESAQLYVTGKDNFYTV